MTDDQKALVDETGLMTRVARIELLEAIEALDELDAAIAEFDNESDEKLQAAKDLVTPAETAVEKVDDASLRARLADAKDAIEAEELLVTAFLAEVNALAAVNAATDAEEMKIALDALNEVTAVASYTGNNAARLVLAQKVLDAKVEGVDFTRTTIEAALV